MKKLNWLFLSLMLFLGMGTAFAEEGEGEVTPPSITLPTPTFKPVSGSAVAPGTIVTVDLPQVIKSDLAAYMGVMVIYVENNEEVELLPDAQTLSAASTEDMGFGVMDDEEKPEPRLWKTATFDADMYKTWMSNVEVSATEGTSKLRMRLAVITFADHNTVQFSEEFTATYKIDPDAVQRPAAPTFTLEDGKLYLKNEYSLTEEELEALIAEKMENGELEEADIEDFATQFMMQKGTHPILYVVNGTNAAFDGITDVATMAAAVADEERGLLEYEDEDEDEDEDEGIDYKAGQVIKAVTAEIAMGGSVQKVVLSLVATYPELPAAPVFNPNGGEVESGTKVILTNGTENDATPLPIYYNFKAEGNESYFTNIKTKTALDAAITRQPVSLRAVNAYPEGGIELTAEKPISAATASIDAEGNVTWSEVVTRKFTIKKVVSDKPEAPVFTPNGGEVANGVPAITLATACEDCDIYYTIGGSEENFYPEDYDDLGAAEQNGVLTAYDGAITLTANASISAGAALVDDEGKITWSDIVTKSFTVTGEAPETVAAPVITPANDAAVHIGNLVTITCATAGAEIYYTTDGTAPYTSDDNGPVAVKESAIKYTEPFELTEDMLIKQGTVWALKVRAVAKKGGSISLGNGVGYVAYPNEPEFSVAAGEVLVGTKVTINCVPSQADIYYTLDGTTPTMEDGLKYTDPIEITEDMTLKARAVLGQYQSSVVTAVYTVTEQIEEIAAPVFSLASGQVEKGTEVSIACVTEGATIYYALTDLPENLTEATEYKAPIVINEDVTVKAIAVKGEAKSEVAEATYTVKPEGPAANEDEELAGVSVYPNPSSGVINLELPVAATIEVFASNGTLYQYLNAGAGVTTLNINRSGIYFLRITGEGRTAIKRVIVR